MQSTDPRLEALKRLRADLPLYAERCLRIRSKSGKIQPLRFNGVQAYAHRRIEEQRAKTGRVRALVLKARQQGLSTYIGARFYHRTSLNKGLRAFILTHEQDASETLFQIVDRFHRLSPAKPTASRANVRELQFGRLDSGYEVGSAGTQAVGRSKTVQMLHGSEVAFWKNAKDHFAGVVQTIPDLPGTEVLLESTGNGPRGEFFERWQQAEAGIGDYIAVFVPWFWSDEYRRPVGPDFRLDPEENDYAGLHGLDDEQMAWRRAKLAELKDPLLFMQEYPATSQEAFQATGKDSFIQVKDVLAARKADIEPVGPLIIGVDPKREGTDRFSIAWRRGRKVLKVESDPDPTDNIISAGTLKTIIDADKPDQVFMDVGGNGGGIYDIMKTWGEPYKSVIKLVNFGAKALEPVQILPDGTKRPGPKLRRDEMWWKSREWLQDVGGADIPDSGSLQADATSPGYSYDIDQRLMLESKAHLAISPDEWDAVALTFAEPVEEPRKAVERPRAPAGGWMG
jgi:hypothetical protein